MPTMTSADAKVLARLHHAGQTDQAGASYIDHLTRVAHAAQRRAEWAREQGLPIDVQAVTAAAWLHDIVEDTPVTFEELRAHGASDVVLAMVALLTKPKKRAPYEERIRTVIDSGNLGAILIKWSDNEDNADPARPLPEASALPARYAASMARLRKSAEALGYRES